VASTLGVIAIVVTGVMYVILSVYAVMLCIFAGHKLVRAEQAPFELCTLVVAMIAVLSTLCNLGERISSNLCVGVLWLDFWPAFVVWTMLIDKMLELNLVFNSTKRGVKWDARRRWLWIVGANIPYVSILIGMSVFHPSQLYELVYKFHDVVPVTFQHYSCSHPSWHVLNVLYGYIVVIVLYGLYITSKAFGALTLADTVWNNQKSIRKWNIRLTTYACYILSVFLLATTIASSLVAENSNWKNYLYDYTVVQAAVVCVAMSIIWAPKVRARCIPTHLYNQSCD
jgi:hypothetical protein